MSDLNDFLGTVFNAKKTVVTKTHSGGNDANGAAGKVGIELASLEHTVASDVESVVMIGTIDVFLQGAEASHILQCWRNEIPAQDGLSYNHSTLVGNCVLHTRISGGETRSANFILADNNLADSTQQRYRWTMLTSTGNSQSRSITIHYLTNPLWDLRNL